MPDAPAKDASVGAQGAPLGECTASSVEASTTAAVRTEAREAHSRPRAQDVVILGPPTADGAGVHVLRAREETVEVGELRPLEEGRPLAGEVVTLAPRKDNPRVCDVKDSYLPPGVAATPAALAHKGPAKVATEAYRDGWDEVFGKKPPLPPSAAN